MWDPLIRSSAGQTTHHFAFNSFAAYPLLTFN
jgi:hypothetical protein